MHEGVFESCRDTEFHRLATRDRELRHLVFEVPVHGIERIPRHEKSMLIK